MAGKKTLILQLLVFLGSVLTVFNEQFQEMLQDNPQLAGYIGVTIAVIGAVVRFYTTGPVNLGIGKKE